MRRLLATLFCAAMLFGATSHRPQAPPTLPSARTQPRGLLYPGRRDRSAGPPFRLVAQDPKYFGQPIVILNKPGAGGMTGWNWIMERGSKDGLTMTAYNMPHFIANPS